MFTVTPNFKNRLERVVEIWKADEARNVLDMVRDLESRDASGVPERLDGNWDFHDSGVNQFAVMLTRNEGYTVERPVVFEDFLEWLGFDRDMYCGTVPLGKALAQAKVYTVECGSSEDFISNAFNPSRYSGNFAASYSGYKYRCCELAQQYRRHCAEFFTKVMPCTVMVVKDDSGMIYGRALLFSDVTFCWVDEDGPHTFHGSLLTYVRLPKPGATVWKIIDNTAKEWGVDAIDWGSSMDSGLSDDVTIENQELLTFPFAGNPYCLVPINADLSYKGPAVYAGAFRCVYRNIMTGDLLASTAVRDSIDPQLAYWGPARGRWLSCVGNYCHICGEPSFDRLCEVCSEKTGVVSTIFGDFSTKDVDLAIAPRALTNTWIDEVFCKGDTDVKYYE